MKKTYNVEVDCLIVQLRWRKRLRILRELRTRH